MVFHHELRSISQFPVQKFDEKASTMRDLNSKIAVGSNGTKDKGIFQIRVGGRYYLRCGLSNGLPEPHSACSANETRFRT
jgi:hypothetical protein